MFVWRSSWSFQSSILAADRILLLVLVLRSLLHLLRRFEHSKIKHLYIVFLGNVRSRVAQDGCTTLSEAPMAYRFEERPRRNACHPRHGRSMASRAGRIIRCSTLSRLIGSPSSERKTEPNSGLPADLRYASRISAKAGIIGTESRLGRVFGRLTTDLHIERLIFSSLPV